MNAQHQNVAAELERQGASTPDQPSTVWHRFARVYASIMNHAVMVIGSFCCFIAVGHDEDRHDEELRQATGLVHALRLLLANLIMPFSETLGTATLPNGVDLVGMELLIWTPFVVGLFVLGVALLGHLSLQTRRRWIVLLYGFFAVLLLVFKAEHHTVVRKIIHAEDLASLRSMSTDDNRSTFIQSTLFEEPYKAWVSVYDGQQCKAMEPKRPADGPRLKCKSSFEGQLVELIVQEICHTRDAPGGEHSARFKQRVQHCNNQGKEFKIFPSSNRPREQIFCQCRTAIYDWFYVALTCLIFMWCAEAVGVCFILYFGVEKDLARMDIRSRKEVIAFALLAMVMLMSRATLLMPYFDSDLGEL